MIVRFFLILLLFALSRHPLMAQTNLSAVPARPTGLRANLVTSERELDVFLTDRKSGVLYYRPPNVPEGVSAQLKVTDIRDCRFILEWDDAAIFAATRERKWLTASQLILGPVTPALPYLDLPGHEICGKISEAAGYLARAARTLLQSGTTTASTGIQRMDQARDLYMKLAAVTWFTGNTEARIRAIQCDIEAGRLDAAERAIEEMLEPDEASPDFGRYWLARAQIQVARESYSEAADSAARSLAFEDKDMETFTEASLLAARCCEEGLEWHRARDLYYEVARLFRGTEAGDRARSRLEFIVNGKLTSEREESNVAKVFFGTEEDMEALVRDFLAGKETPAVTESKEEKKP